jgi:hypothetical protein
VGYLRILIENSLVSKAGSKAEILTGSPEYKSSTLKMISSFETLITSYKSARRHNTETRTQN